jgi:hypothetical protein
MLCSGGGGGDVGGVVVLSLRGKSKGDYAMVLFEMKKVLMMADSL